MTPEELRDNPLTEFEWRIWNRAIEAAASKCIMRDDLGEIGNLCQDLADDIRSLKRETTIPSGTQK